MVNVQKKSEIYTNCNEETEKSRRGGALPPSFMHINAIIKRYCDRPSLITQGQAIGESKESLAFLAIKIFCEEA
ncbi:MAG: hypothetical protein M1G31_10035 [Pseudanabaena sp. Salubria-1]|nr:hypothetical protein [Pseudanabaena sp. Salubria-1]